MKKQIFLALGLMIAAGATAQTMRATSEREVTKNSVTVKLIYDPDNGRQACKDSLRPMCSSQSYSCTYGVEYSFLDESTVQATYRSTWEPSPGVIYHVYDCRGTCVGVCNYPPPPKDPAIRDTCPACTPVILDLGNAGIRMTSAAEGVSFDIDADGWAEHISWTAAEERDGFLVFDRNHNGLIDDGGELFGDATWQPESETPNGFAALRVHDAAYLGGNEDDELSAADAVWPFLRIWIDSSHDGVSQMEEIYTLEHFGILSIDLDPVEARARDRFGNEFRYRSKATLEGHPPLTDVVDVFLQHEPE